MNLSREKEGRKEERRKTRLDGGYWGGRYIDTLDGMDGMEFSFKFFFKKI